MTIKKATEEYITNEEEKYLGRKIGDKFVEPKNQIAGYESISVELVSATSYYDFINAAIPACFDTWDTTPHNIVEEIRSKKFIERERQVLNILKDRPISVALEFPTFFFNMKGIPRSITHQIVRHRQMAFGQQSYRVSSCYADPVRAPQDLIEQDNENLLNEYQEVVKTVREMYKKLIENGVPMEQARNIMPMGTCTTISVNMRLRDMIAYFKGRTSGIAQDEHTYMVYKMIEEIQSKEPLWFSFLCSNIENLEEKMKKYVIN